MSATDYEIDGVVEEIIFENDENGYRVFSVDVGNNLITAVAVCSQLYVGEAITASGVWTNHNTYGKQFQCEELEKSFPYEIDSMQKFLSSGIIKGVGPSTAKKILDKFGENSFAVIEHKPQLLSQIDRISNERAVSISESFKAVIGMRDILLMLTDYGISPGAAAKIYQKFSSSAIDIINIDPYRFWEEMDGFAFDVADRIAIENGHDPLGELRISYCLKYILVHNMQNGHTFLPMTKLVSIGSSFVNTDKESVLTIAERMCEKKTLVCAMVGDLCAVFLPDNYTAESYISKKLAQICDFNENNITDIDHKIKALEKSLCISYAEKQKLAIRSAIQNKVMVMTGGPGTGKTTTLKGILTLFEQLNLNYLLCAPTGRAAKRMSEVCNRPAKTIHRLLEVEHFNGVLFAKNEHNPLKTDVVIVDEMSMIDISLFEALLRAMPSSSRLILVGDADQLPSVGAGNVFLDIIRSGKVETVFLSEIFRQATESSIVVSAHKINNGQYPELDNSKDFFFIRKKTSDTVVEAVTKLVSERLPEVYKKDVMNGVQIIIPTKKTMTGTASINKQLRDIVNPHTENKASAMIKDTLYREGDKVMQTKNNYEIVVTRIDGKSEIGVYNGDIGVIEQVLLKEKKLFIRFEDNRLAEYNFQDANQLEIAYAITVHKSQGSEFDIVVLVLSELTPLLQYRNLLYTAVTRAREMLIVVGDEQILKKMVDNDKRSNRYSALKYFLQDNVNMVEDDL